MKIYCVSDYEHGVFNTSSELLQPTVCAPPANLGDVGKSGNVGKRKGPRDLLVLIPSGSPIQQSELFEAARAAGINEKYVRRFLGSLLADGLILVRKFHARRLKALSVISR